MSPARDRPGSPILAELVLYKLFKPTVKNRQAPKFLRHRDPPAPFPATRCCYRSPWRQPPAPASQQVRVVAQLAGSRRFFTFSTNFATLPLWINEQRPLAVFVLNPLVFSFKRA
jgi:hypothetical protein